MTTSRSSSTLALLLLLLVGVAVLGARERTGGRTDAARPPAPAEHSAMVLDAGVACLDAGYLCADLARADSFRILRWPDDVRTLRIDVPLPDLADAGRARTLRAAAVRGILAWQDAPLRLVVNGAGGGAPDIAVSWTEVLEEGRLGETRIEWEERGGVVTFRVPRFLLRTTSPASGRTLAPEEVELVAVHEMGHALGLPHSDAPRDVMFPEKTARFLTTRDHRTVGALYATPTGALVRAGTSSY